MNALAVAHGETNACRDLYIDLIMCESTIDALNAAYDKVVPGGFVIVDDYGAVDACRKAVAVFGRTHSNNTAMRDIHGIGAWWVKPA